MKILIAVPTYESIMPDTQKAIHYLTKHTFYETGCYPDFDFIRGYATDAARNRCVDVTKGRGFDYLLTIDNDVVLPEDALVNLLSHDEEVVLGYYAHRNSNGTYDGKTSICKLGEHSFTQQYTREELRALRESGQYKIEIHGGGMGCALFKASVFDKISFPWFRWYIYEDRHGTLSEDLYFCVKCERFGIKVYADTRVHCKHMFRYLQECD